jgi:hypothetical protein
MPQIILNFTNENRQRVLDAFRGFSLLPDTNPETGQPYTDPEYFKQGLVALVAREVFSFELSKVRSSARANRLAAEKAVVKDEAIGI